MTFPIQIETPEHAWPPQRASIPLALIAPHEAQALINHGGQSLKRLAERHGLSASEAVAVIEDKPFHERWPQALARTIGARNAFISEAIKRLNELCEEYEKANP